MSKESEQLDVGKPGPVGCFPGCGVHDSRPRPTLVRVEEAETTGERLTVLVIVVLAALTVVGLWWALA